MARGSLEQHGATQGLSSVGIVKQRWSAVTLRGHQGKVDHVAVSTGAARIATASRAASHPDNTGEIKVWDGSLGKVLFEHEAKGLTVTRIALSPNGARLAFASVEVDGEAAEIRIHAG